MSKTYTSIRPDQLQMEIFTFQMLTLQQARGLPLLLVLSYGMKYPLKLEMQSLLILSDQSSKLSIHHNNKIRYDTQDFFSLSFIPYN